MTNPFSFGAARACLAAALCAGLVSACEQGATYKKGDASVDSKNEVAGEAPPSTDGTGGDTPSDVPQPNEDVMPMPDAPASTADATSDTATGDTAPDAPGSDHGAAPDAACDSGTDGNTCVNHTLGQKCTIATECVSGACVDGVCCSTSSCSTCNRCNLNGVGTCSAVSKGADALCPISAAGCTAGCDGLGKCAPANAGTDCVTPNCSQLDSVGSVAHVGVYTSVSFKRSACDGVTAGAGGCKAQTDNGCGNYVCAGAASCKTTCSGDVDCKGGLRCSSGTCVAKSGAGTACTSGEQCATGGCAQQDFVDAAPVCHACSSNAQCPTNAPVCLSDTWSCTGCGVGDPADCNADGSTNCNVGGCYASTARDCGKPSIAANHCSCGALDKCPSWMVCITSACKVAGGHPCVNSSDCASGNCQAGVCSQTPLGGYCIGDIPNECASGTCGPNWVNGPGGFPIDGMTCQ